jgi:Spy/CpxP family protein refolding chaperone
LEHRRLLRQKFDVADAELARAFARGDLSDEAAEALVTRVEDLRRQRNVARLRLLVALYFLLTPEQRERLRQVVDKASIGIATSC